MPDEYRRAVTHPACEVLFDRCNQEIHHYSRSSLPVSSRNSVSRFGLRRLVSVTLPPAPLTAAKICGRCCDAFDSVSNKVNRLEALFVQLTSQSDAGLRA